MPETCLEDRLNGLCVQSEYGRHRAGPLASRLEHQFSASPDETQSVLEAKRTRGDVGRVLAQAVPRRALGRRPVRARAPLPEYGDRVNEDRGLGVLRHPKLLFRALEADLREREPENLVGLLEHPTRFGKGVDQRPPHPDELRSLSGKDQCGLHDLPSRHGLPPNQGRAPGQTATEDDHQDQVPRLQTPRPACLVEGERDRGCGGITILVDVREYLFHAGYRAASSSPR